MAAPFGPPPSLAMRCCLPSGMTRVSVWRAISTRITEPSGMATGPSGNFRPDVISLCGVVMVVSPLLALEGGLALGEEGRDAFLEIFAAAQLTLEVALDVELPAEVVAARAVHRLLDARQRYRRPIGQPACELGRRPQQFAILDDVPDQAPFPGLLGRNLRRQHGERPRPLLPHHPRQEPGAAAVRQQANAGEGLQEGPGLRR